MINSVCKEVLFQKLSTAYSSMNPHRELSMHMFTFATHNQLPLKTPLVMFSRVLLLQFFYQFIGYGLHPNTVLVLRRAQRTS